MAWFYIFNATHPQVNCIFLHYCSNYHQWHDVVQRMERSWFHDKLCRSAQPSDFSRRLFSYTLVSGRQCCTFFFSNCPRCKLTQELQQCVIFDRTLLSTWPQISTTCLKSHLTRGCKEDWGYSCPLMHRSGERELELVFLTGAVQALAATTLAMFDNHVVLQLLAVRQLLLGHINSTDLPLIHPQETNMQTLQILSPRTSHAKSCIENSILTINMIQFHFRDIHQGFWSPYYSHICFYSKTLQTVVVVVPEGVCFSFAKLKIIRPTIKQQTSETFWQH